MFKLILNRIFCLILAIAVVFSATGITVFKMACSKSKTYNVSLEQFDNCCKKNKASSCSVNKSCCNISVNTISSVQQFTQKDNFKIAVAEISLIKYFSLDFLVSVVNFTFKKNFSPPPLAGADIILLYLI